MDISDLSEEQLIEMKRLDLVNLRNEVSVLLKMCIDTLCEGYKYIELNEIDFILILNNRDIEAAASSHASPSTIKHIISDLHEKLKTDQPTTMSELNKRRKQH